MLTIFHAVVPATTVSPSSVKFRTLSAVTSASPCCPVVVMESTQVPPLAAPMRRRGRIDFMFAANCDVDGAPVLSVTWLELILPSSVMAPTNFKPTASLKSGMGGGAGGGGGAGSGG